MGTPFKMRGSPMARNFGIGSPLHDHEKDRDGDVIQHQDMTAVNDSTTVGNPWLDPENQDLVKVGVISQEQLNSMGRKYEKNKEQHYDNREYRHNYKKQSQQPG